MTPMTEPLISIVIPAYEMKGQGVAFLKRALASIEKQIDVDPRAIEIVVSDQSADRRLHNFAKLLHRQFNIIAPRRAAALLRII